MRLAMVFTERVEKGLPDLHARVQAMKAVNQ
jgi:hypothetical protein